MAPKVLIVDDEAELVTAFSRILDHEDYDVERASSGEAASATCKAVCVAVSPAVKSGEETYCVTSSILPSQAIGVRRWSEALGTMMPSPQGERQVKSLGSCNLG